MKKKYPVTVILEVMYSVEIAAESWDEAIKIVEDSGLTGQDIYAGDPADLGFTRLEHSEIESIEQPVCLDEDELEEADEDEPNDYGIGLYSDRLKPIGCAWAGCKEQSTRLHEATSAFYCEFHYKQAEGYLHSCRYADCIEPAVRELVTPTGIWPLCEKHYQQTQAHYAPRPASPQDDDDDLPPYDGRSYTRHVEGN